MITRYNNDNTNGGESQVNKSENLYEFEAGLVRLDWSEETSQFFALLDGEDMMRDLPEGWKRNPYITAQYFARGVHDVLRQRIKAWLKRHGYNLVTGCRVDLSCAECRRRGLDTAEKGCIEIRETDNGR